MEFNDISLNYMEPPKATALLREARKNGRPVYICGMAGYGKTELVKQFFHGKTVSYISFQSSTNDYHVELPLNINRKTQAVVIFDDLQFANESVANSFILPLAQREDVLPIFIARIEFPAWLLTYNRLSDMVYISETELAINVETFEDYLDIQEIDTQREKLLKIQSFIKGNPFAMIALAQKFHTTSNLVDLQEYLFSIMSSHFEQHILPSWDVLLYQFVLKMSVVGAFTKELAEYLIENPMVERYLEKAASVGNFISCKYGVYGLRPFVRGLLYRKALVEFGDEYIHNLSLRAALWYENHGELDKALNLYNREGDKDSIKGLLIRNAKENPSNGYYHKFARFYTELPEEEVSSNIHLMVGTSMSYALLLQCDKAEFWYKKLAAYTKTVDGEERKLARTWLAFLDISLPFRDCTSILATFKSFSTFIINREVTMPEFSTTSNLPSLMNGGQDFCEWSLKDDEFASRYGNLVSVALGNQGKSLVNLALAESFFEKGKNDDLVISHLSHGQYEADSVGNLEMEFVAVGLFTRFYLGKGMEDTARIQLEVFMDKCLEHHREKILPNLQALYARINLLTGRDREVEFWLSSAPNEKKELIALLRYEYMTKIRCYLAKGRYTEAEVLLEKMLLYTELCHRKYIEMECNMLYAILNFKIGGDWKPFLDKALKVAGYYQFIRPLSDEGVALLPLLQRMKASDYDETWFLKLIKETANMASLYPDYMHREEAVPSDFSGNALSILHLQMQGLSTPEIAEKLNLKIENVRYHIKQNYKKLGVTDKTQAIMTARKLKI